MGALAVTTPAYLGVKLRGGVVGGVHRLDAVRLPKHRSMGQDMSKKCTVLEFIRRKAIMSTRRP